jgi:hypothetical protein
MTPEKLAVARRMYDSREHTVEAIAETSSVSNGNAVTTAENVAWRVSDERVGLG